jgi:hypothetical protein
MKQADAGIIMSYTFYIKYNTTCICYKFNTKNIFCSSGKWDGYSSPVFWSCTCNTYCLCIARWSYQWWTARAASKICVKPGWGSTSSCTAPSCAPVERPTSILARAMAGRLLSALLRYLRHFTKSWDLNDRSRYLGIYVIQSLDLEKSAIPSF